METDRRQFLRGMVTMGAGVTLFGEGIGYLVADGLKEARIQAKARETVEQQTNSDEVVQKNKEQRLREEGITPSSYGFNLARAVGGVILTVFGIEEMQEDVARNREATAQNNSNQPLTG